MNMQTEPARIVGYLIGAFTAVGTFFVQWGQGGDWRIAVGTAFLSFAVPAGGAEVVRSRVYSPATADRIMDAEAVIAAAEF